MRSQRTGLRSARIGVVASSFAVVATLLLSNVAFAASTAIGSAAGTKNCVVDYDFVQISSSGKSYVVPAGGGSITSWSTLVGTGLANLGPASLEVWRLASGTYTLVGIGSPQTLTPGALNTFPVNITVQGRDLLGLHVGGQMLCLQPTAVPTDIVGYAYNPTPGVDQTMLQIAGFQLNVAAIVSANVAPPPSGDCDQPGKSTAKARCTDKDKDKAKEKEKEKEKAGKVHGHDA